jgi:RHS repeat-associated protein
VNNDASDGGQDPTWADLNSTNAITTRRLWALDQVFARLGASTDWYLPDRLGSIRGFMNNGGTLDDTINFDAIGNKTSESTPANGDRMGYAGGQFDSNLLVILFGREHGRWLIPADQMWLSQDAIGLQAGPNPYKYAENAPVNFTDPSGLQVAAFLRSNFSNETGVRAFLEYVIEQGTNVTPDATNMALIRNSAGNHSIGPQPILYDIQSQGYITPAQARALLPFYQPPPPLVILADPPRRPRRDLLNPYGAEQHSAYRSPERQREEEQAANESMAFFVRLIPILGSGSEIVEGFRNGNPGQVLLGTLGLGLDVFAVGWLVRGGRAARSGGRAAAAGGATRVVLAPTVQNINARLLAHVRAAVAHVDASRANLLGQLSRARRLQYGRGEMQAALRGIAIEEYARGLIEADEWLMRHITLGARNRGPDIILNAGGHWWDITTTAAWPEHLGRPARLGYTGTGHLLPTSP